MTSRIPTRGRVLAHMNPVSGAIAVALGSTVAMPIAAVAETDELVVTATRRESTVQDVPYNIAAVGADELQSKRITNLNDFAREVPGLTLTDQGGRDSDLLTVRGLNTSNIDAPEIFLGNGGGETVATYVGEIPVYVDLKLVDVERVEVLIGPQGTLYGAGTLGGAIRYIPNAPVLDETTVELHGSLYDMWESNDMGYNGDVTVNIPINDRMAFRGSFLYDETPGFIDYNYVVGTDQAGMVNPEDLSALRQFPDANDTETVAVKGAVLWEISDEVDATLTYYYQQVESGGRTADSDVAFGTGRYVYGRRFLEPNERENSIVSLEVHWDLGFAELTSATGYTNYEDDGQRDQTDLLLDIGYGYETFPNFAAFTSDRAEEESITQEVRLVSTSDGPLSWIVGAFYRDLEVDSIAEEFTPGYSASPEYIGNVVDFGGIPVGMITTGDLEYRAIIDQTIEEIALFGEIGYQFTDAWQVTVGARWFEYEDDTKNSTRLPFFDDAQPPFPVGTKVDDDDVILKFNTSYAYEDVWGSDSGTAYLTVSEGYRNGGSNGLDACDGSPGQSVCATPAEQLVEADTTLNSEIGIKTNWLDGAVTFNASYYMIDWDDIRISTVTETGLAPIDTNGGEAESKGYELSGVWQINDSWSATATYADTDAELTQSAAGVIGGRFGSVDGEDGDRLPGTPEQQGSLYVNYTTETDTGLLVDVRYGFTSISDVLTKVGGKNGGESLSGFTIHNASVAVSRDNWTATLFADNLTNKYAATGVRRDRDYIDTVGGVTLRSYYQNIIQPRTVGLDLRYSFDL
jgi:iron complex outermembrane receptor protein